MCMKKPTLKNTAFEHVEFKKTAQLAKIKQDATDIQNKLIYVRFFK